MEQACHGSMDNFIPVSSRTMSTIMGKLFIILVNTEKKQVLFGIIVPFLEPVSIILSIAEATPIARRRSLENGTNPTQVQGSFLVILISILWVSVFKLLKTWVLQNSTLAGPLRPLLVTLLDPHTWWVCYICWSQIGHSEIMQMLSWSFGAIFVIIVVVLNWMFSAWPWVPWHAL